MRRTIAWSDEAVGHLLVVAKSNTRQAARIREAVARFGRDETGDIKKLQGDSGRWRLRVGDWRVIFEERPGQTLVVAVENRRDAYDD